MNIKRLVVGTVIGAVAIYILGYVIWDVISAGFFNDNRTDLAVTQLRCAPFVGDRGAAG